VPELISPLELIDQEEQETPVAPADMDLEAVRELVLRAHPDVVPEMVSGDSVGTMLESVEAARAAYARLTESWSAANPRPVAVPAGGGAVLPVDPGKLPAAEKIRRGLKAATTRRDTRQEG
jgi:hypothetical protein